MISVTDLLRMSRSDYAELLRTGHPIDPKALDDTEYRGISLGMPALFDRLTWKTFKKVFHRDPRTGQLRGWNVRIVQRGIDGPFEPMRERGEPRTFGHYRVVDGSPYPSPILAPHALMLDYGLGGNGRLDPMQRMRDPLVALEANDVELLLGWSYVDLGRLRLNTPSWFCLQRDIPLTHRHDPPRAV